MLEPTTGIEPVNLFLTKEALYRLSYVGVVRTSYLIVSGLLLCMIWSGRRDSNSRHPAWKAEALPTELLPPWQTLIVILRITPSLNIKGGRNELAYSTL